MSPHNIFGVLRYILKMKTINFFEEYLRVVGHWNIKKLLPICAHIQAHDNNSFTYMRIMNYFLLRISKTQE